jgi:multicomponent Na+:H+ antiporter subunit E
MSTEATAARTGRYRPARLRFLQIPALLWLTLVWVALWGDVSFANVLGGLLVAVVVCLAFPLPPVRTQLRVRPISLVWLVAYFLADLVRASIEVAWTTLRLRYQPRNAVVEVNLRTNSDFVLAVVAEMVTLVPGSIVVDVRRFTHTLFLHVLDAKDMAGVEKARARVLAQERRVVLALGGATGHLAGEHAGQPSDREPPPETVERDAP